MDKSRQNYKYKNERFKNKLAKSSINSVFIQNMHTVLVRWQNKRDIFLHKTICSIDNWFFYIKSHYMCKSLK